MIYDKVMTHTFEVAVVNNYGNTRYSKTFNSFTKAKTLFDEMPPVLYKDEKVVIIPHRNK